jgi:hypothetical protein
MPTNNDLRFDEWVRTAKYYIESLPQRVAGEVESQVSVAPPLSDSVRGEATRHHTTFRVIDTIGGRNSIIPRLNSAEVVQ